jgi:hypothetical protein
MILADCGASRPKTTPGSWKTGHRTPASAFFAHPRCFGDRVVVSAIVAVVVGFVFGFWGQNFLPGFFYDTLPLPAGAAPDSTARQGRA